MRADRDSGLRHDPVKNLAGYAVNDRGVNAATIFLPSGAVPAIDGIFTRGHGGVAPKSSPVPTPSQTQTSGYHLAKAMVMVTASPGPRSMKHETVEVAQQLASTRLASSVPTLSRFAHLAANSPAKERQAMVHVVVYSPNAGLQTLRSLYPTASNQAC